jgi:hypothetical protein
LHLSSAPHFLSNSPSSSLKSSNHLNYYLPTHIAMNNVNNNERPYPLKPVDTSSASENVGCLFFFLFSVYLLLFF